MTELSSIIEAIEILKSSAGGAAASFIEVRDNGSETIVGGNYVGLLYLARDLLVLAEQGGDGSHVHIDQFSSADVADRPLVLRRVTPHEP
jgi:hypothetical protein